MQTAIQQPTDDELRAMDLACRQWWCRVYLLVHSTGCSLEHAIQAIQQVDKERGS